MMNNPSPETTASRVPKKDPLVIAVEDLFVPSACWIEREDGTIRKDVLCDNTKKGA